MLTSARSKTGAAGGSRNPAPVSRAGLPALPWFPLPRLPRVTGLRVTVIWWKSSQRRDGWLSCRRLFTLAAAAA